MLYGCVSPCPCPGFFTGGMKSNGITSNGAAVSGPFFAIDTPVNNKHNRTVTVFGDLSYTPTLWTLISDLDFLDAPLYHLGFM